MVLESNQIYPLCNFWHQERFEITLPLHQIEHMGLLDFLGFGKKRMTKIADFKNRGAIMIDVRSQAEFNSGHAPGTICIPLDRFKNEVKNLQKRKKPVLVCCATGSRSGMASSILNQNGIECYNAGGWRNLN